jgi:hypothetical protein
MTVIDIINPTTILLGISSYITTNYFQKTLNSVKELKYVLKKYVIENMD